MELPAVRVARSHLDNYTGRSVRLVGKVVSNDGGNAVLEDAEGQSVTPIPPHPLPFRESLPRHDNHDRQRWLSPLNFRTSP